MKTVTLVPGDGIGPEITDAVKAVFEAARVDIAWEVIEVGLESYKKTGTLVPGEFVESIKKNKVALKGPTTTPVGGGHRSINVTIRQQFNLFANVRPISNLPGLRCNYDKIDLIIVRENSEDLYKGIEYKVSESVAQGVKLITEEASRRIGVHAFELAKRQNRKRVTIVHKANIMKYTDGLFLDTIRDVAKSYPEIICDDLIIDNCCMQLVTKPQQFDIIVTENLYGDILSDLSAGLVGGLGLAAGGNLGNGCAVFEAVHGSAPDIAGKGLANPTALLLSAIMLLNHLEMPEQAELIKTSLYKTIADPKTRTKDIGGDQTTEQFTSAIIENLGR